MDNYIVINGKKAELTQEQLEKLGIVVEKKDPFAFSEDKYYFINAMGTLSEMKKGDTFYNEDYSKLHHEVANYCADKELMEQRALHETLNRLLWRYSMQHGGGEIDWIDYSKAKYLIYLKDNGVYCVDYVCSTLDIGAVHFCSSATAEAAIEEIVKPFMAEHPEFRW